MAKRNARAMKELREAYRANRVMHASAYPDIKGGPTSKFYYNHSSVDLKGVTDTGIAPAYREKFVCFDCCHYSKTQVSAKRYENVYGYETQYIIQFATSKRPTCPHCHETMERVGPKFRPPKKNDKRGWEASRDGNYDYTYNEYVSRTHGWSRDKHQ